MTSFVCSRLAVNAGRPSAEVDVTLCCESLFFPQEGSGASSSVIETASHATWYYS